MTKSKYAHSSLDHLLKETGDFTEISVVAIKRVIAWQGSQKMDNEKISKTRMAELMETSRSTLDRLLDPQNTSVTLHILEKAAKAIGKTPHVELV